jgi:hypothetical protein
MVTWVAWLTIPDDVLAGLAAERSEAERPRECW